MLKTLPALKRAYQTAVEIRGQIKENETLRSITSGQLSSITTAVESTRRGMKYLSERGPAPEMVAQYYAAKSRLDDAIADQEPVAKKFSALIDTFNRLRTREEEVKAELLLHTVDAISEIDRDHKVSIKKNLRQVFFDIYNASVLASKVSNHGFVGFSEQPDPDLVGNGADWDFVLADFLREAFPAPSLDECKAEMAAFKERYGFPGTGK